MSLMRYTIQQRCGHARVAKNLCPISKTHIGGYDDRFSFMAFSQYLEDQLGSLLGERNIAQFVNNEQSVTGIPFDRTA